MTYLQAVRGKNIKRPQRERATQRATAKILLPGAHSPRMMPGRVWSKEMPNPSKELKKTNNITEQEAKKVLFRIKHFIESFGEEVPHRLQEVWDDILLLYRMLWDWYEGNYRAPWKAISAIAVGFIYLMNPFDMIPDFIFIVGWIDDVAVIKKLLIYIREDLEDYKKFLRESNLL